MAGRWTNNGLHNLQLYASLILDMLFAIDRRKRHLAAYGVYTDTFVSIGIIHRIWIYV